MSWLARLGERAGRWALRNPFTNVYGASRSLLALATASTLALNPLAVLFTPAIGAYDPPMCDDVFTSVFCVTRGHADALRWLSVAILLVVASGWRPRVTALPHVWVAYSFFVSSTVRDGGDQVSLVLTALLLPVALLDARIWQWSGDTAPRSTPYGRLIAWSALSVIRLQVAAIYFVAALSKLHSPEWTNGTAMYYWLSSFGAPRWVMTLMHHPLPVTLATWGTIALELALASGLVVRREKWHGLFVAGLVFHFFIALLLGLWTFSAAMVAALLLYLHPPDQPLRLPRALNRGVQRLRSRWT
jgi:antimicrobial peptide system SdpB family protein